MTNTAPRIYVACLASYNNGVLHGAWVDASAEVDDMWPEINAVLRSSKFPNVTVPDYEAAAKAAGWSLSADGWWNKEGQPSEASAKDVCEVPDSNREKIAPVMVPSAEEWAIHDHEGLGDDLGEYAGLAEVARRVSIIDLADDRNIPADVLMAYAHDYMSGEWDADDLDSKLDDAYDGTAESWKDFCETQSEDIYSEDLDNLPDWLRFHIDWEGIARDWELGGDWSTYRDGDGGALYFFRANC